MRKCHGWLYETETLSDSRDSSWHVELILRALVGREAAVATLQARGCEFDICSFWVGIGQGGPQLHAPQMRKLGALGFDIWWDTYFDDEQHLEQAIVAVATKTPAGLKREIIEAITAKVRAAHLDSSGQWRQEVREERIAKRLQERRKKIEAAANPAQPWKNSPPPHRYLTLEPFK